MARPPKYRFEVEEIAEALRKSGGILTEAAKYISTKTGKACTRRTIAQMCMQHSTQLDPVLRESRELVCDLAETNLIREIQRGSVNAIRYYLDNQGRHRGYGHRLFVDQHITVTGPPSAPIKPGQLDVLAPMSLDNKRQLLADMSGDGSVTPKPDST